MNKFDEFQFEAYESAVPYKGRNKRCHGNKIVVCHFE